MDASELSNQALSIFAVSVKMCVMKRFLDGRHFLASCLIVFVSLSLASIALTVNSGHSNCWFNQVKGNSWWTISLYSYQTLKIFFAHYCRLFIVIIRFQNVSILLRFSSGSQMETRSNKFVIVNSYETQVSSFFWYTVFSKWLITDS